MPRYSPLLRRNCFRSTFDFDFALAIAVLPAGAGVFGGRRRPVPVKRGRAAAVGSSADRLHARAGHRPIRRTRRRTRIFGVVGWVVIGSLGSLSLGSLSLSLESVGSLESVHLGFLVLGGVGRRRVLLVERHDPVDTQLDQPGGELTLGDGREAPPPYMPNGAGTGSPMPPGGARCRCGWRIPEAPTRRVPGGPCCR